MKKWLFVLYNSLVQHMLYNLSNVRPIFLQNSQPFTCLCDAAIDRLCPLKLTIFYSETQNSDVTNFVYFQPMYMRIVLVLRILVSRQLCGAPVSSALLGTFSSFFAHGVIELIRFVSLFYGSKQYLIVWSPSLVLCVSRHRHAVIY